MYKGTIYNGKTGMIISTCRASSEADIVLQTTLNPDHKAYIGDELDAMLYYFENDAPASRLRMKLKINGQDHVYTDFGEEPEHQFKVGDILRIDGIPKGTELWYIDGTIIVDDGFIEWTTDTPGVFQFNLSLFPYATTRIYAEFI
ncbi:hypothetical protein S21ZY_032 [Pseudomonas phage ZY21]|nr:hypothetical protein S21ZY_032 [Pseudomonas phage ZY21]